MADTTFMMSEERRGKGEPSSDLSRSSLLTLPSSSGLHAYAVFMSVVTFVLVIAGGLVTSTGSGLAVPDWPLSFGQVFPPMVGGVLYEHSHRLIAASTGLLTIVLAIWLWAGRAKPLLRNLGLWAVGTVVAQGVLGGLTVLFKLPVTISVAHATLGQTFFSLIVCIAVLSSAGPEQAPLAFAGAAKLRRLAVMTTGFIYVQLIVGAVYRHSGHLLHLHMLNALFVAIHVLLFSRRVISTEGIPASLQRPALVMLMLMCAQLFLGIFAWRLPTVLTTTTHVAVGALLLAASIVASVQSFRKAVPA